jgi:hypothetical protein
MKFLLKEEEKNEILNMYGIIKEQTACNWENYQNGDGMSKPKINISKSESGVSASYQGPETGFCIQHAQGSTKDSLHQLAGVVRKVVSDYLKELYNSQNYVYPVLENISMTKKNNFFSINVPFAKTTEDKAITNFNERGGWGHDGSNTLQQFLSSISDETKYALINVIKKYSPKYYLGLDIDIKQLVRALKYHDNVYHFNPTNLSTKWGCDTKWYTMQNETFDYIVANFSIMHFMTNDFWDELNNYVKSGTKLLFNLVNMNASWQYNNSYLKTDMEQTRYKFEWVHKTEKTEPFIKEETVMSYLERYNWVVLNKNVVGKPNELASQYSWWLIQYK